MTQERSKGGAPTAEQWRLIEAALPEAHALGRAFARRCSTLSAGEAQALIEDGLMRRVVDYDSSRGTSLMTYAKSFLLRDLFRAAYKRAHDPMVAAGLDAADIHDDAVSAPDLAVRFAESIEEKNDRALALGADAATAAYYGYAQERVKRSQEDDLVAQETWKELKRAADGAGKNAARLMDFLYVEHLTWDDTAEKLGISVRTAKRLEEKVIGLLREFLLRERG